jgi:hypothetical protein
VSEVLDVPCNMFWTVSSLFLQPVLRGSGKGFVMGSISERCSSSYDARFFYFSAAFDTWDFPVSDGTVVGRDVRFFLGIQSYIDNPFYIQHFSSILRAVITLPGNVGITIWSDAFSSKIFLHAYSF